MEQLTELARYGLIGVAIMALAIGLFALAILLNVQRGNSRQDEALVSIASSLAESTKTGRSLADTAAAQHVFNERMEALQLARNVTAEEQAKATIANTNAIASMDEAIRTGNQYTLKLTETIVDQSRDSRDAATAEFTATRNNSIRVAKEVTAAVEASTNRTLLAIKEVPTETKALLDPAVALIIEKFIELAANVNGKYDDLIEQVAPLFQAAQLINQGMKLFQDGLHEFGIHMTTLKSYFGDGPVDIRMAAEFLKAYEDKRARGELPAFDPLAQPDALLQANKLPEPNSAHAEKSESLVEPKQEPPTDVVQA